MNFILTELNQINANVLYKVSSDKLKTKIIKNEQSRNN